MREKLPEFLYANNKVQAPGKEYLLFTPTPHYLFEILFFNSQNDEMQFTQWDKSGGLYEPVTGYRIYIVFRYTITGKLPLHAETTNHIKQTLLKAAQFYYDTRIENNANRYKRLAVKN